MLLRKHIYKQKRAHKKITKGSAVTVDSDKQVAKDRKWFYYCQIWDLFRLDLQPKCQDIDIPQNVLKDNIVSNKRR